MHVHNELVQVFEEDGIKRAVLFQNGIIEIYTLKPATKQDIQDILQVEQAEK